MMLTAHGVVCASDLSTTPYRIKPLAAFLDDLFHLNCGTGSLCWKDSRGVVLRSCALCCWGMEELGRSH